MRVLLQRVSCASVEVGEEQLGRIDRGLALLVGFGAADDGSVIAPMADKLCGLRVFEDDAGRFQYSVNEIRGDLLAVPQFTLYGETGRGRRPDFTGALEPRRADELFHELVKALEARATGRVARGRFGAHMAVQLINDGPVTLMLEREPAAG